MADMNRREFLATSIAATAATAVTMQSITSHAQVVNGAPPNLPWAERTMRWMQLILVENDPGQFDPQWWLDLFHRTRTDGICLTAGGLCAFYPSSIPFHHRSAWMKEGDDPFGTLVEGCRKLGMTIVARTDSHSVLDDAAKAHPEWLACDADGRPRRHWEMPETRWVTCAYGPYNFEFMTAVHREIVSRYGVDGVFCNRWQGSGLCYCESCRKQFREATGLALPTAASGQDSTYVTYVGWTQQRLEQLWKLWDDEQRAIKPTSRYFSNTGIDIERAVALDTPTYLSESQSRGGNPAWTRGRGAKEFRAFFGRKPIIGLNGITHNSRQSVTTEAEIRLWLLEAIANGLRPWLLKTSAVVNDQRWVPAMERVYAWHAKHEAYLRNEGSLADVAMVFGPNAQRSPSLGARLGLVRAAPFNDGRGGGGGPENDLVPAAHANGMYAALVESRVPFEMVYTGLLRPEDVDKYRLLILPNVLALSDAECDQLRDYVRRGGSLLATYQTSLGDERGRPRPDFRLGELFGVSMTMRDVNNGPNSYMRIERQTRHPLLRGLEDVGQITNASRRVNVRALSTFDPSPLTLIPSFPTIPMEEIYPRVAKTDIPEVFMRELGPTSRVVYFPGDIDRTFWNERLADHVTLLRNAVAWALNDAHTVTVRGPGLLDVVAWRQRASMTVHMVNVTNPMAMRSSFREFIPIGPQQVRVRLPKGTAAHNVRLLVSGEAPRVQRSSETVEITVPTIADHEVVAIDL
jgi:hypothetical protein